MAKVKIAPQATGAGTTTLQAGTSASDFTLTLPDRTGTVAIEPTTYTNALSGDVTLNNTANYFDGPSVAQGTSGTWLVMGTVSVKSTAGGASFGAKLYDGTTVIASAVVQTTAANQLANITVSGVIASPAGNLRIAIRDFSDTSGAILYNAGSLTKDSHITAIRIA